VDFGSTQPLFDRDMIGSCERCRGNGRVWSACLAIFILLSLGGTAEAQWAADSVRSDLARDEKASAPDSKPTVCEKLVYLGGASLLYAGVDYFGFNYTKQNKTQLVMYRVFQIMMQGAITWFLYDKLGLPTAIGFNLIWWTFGLDFLYYGYAEVVNPGHPWESRGDMQGGIFDNDATWAYWTPVGILRGMRRDDGIPGDTLVAQSVIGAVLGIGITITF
jgi:hypothetical protein